jgi:hypothetical protein
MRVFGCNFVRFFAVNPIMAAKSAAFRSKTLHFFFRRQFPNRRLVIGDTLPFIFIIAYSADGATEVGFTLC